MSELGRVAVVGAGLIGTSIALALREQGVEVSLTDRDDAAVRLAVELGAGTPWEDTQEPADLAVLAVPSAAVAEELRRGQLDGLARSYTDVASVKNRPLARAATLGCDLATFVPGHPLAGRERSGPAAARADIFLGRPWALCPSRETAPHAVRTVTALVGACGAEPVTLGPEAHDRAVAVVSHVPHVVASAAAARLGEADAESLRLAGQGLRDTTRVAGGDPELWAGILTANAGPVADVLDALVRDLQSHAAALRTAEAGAGTGDVAALLRRGWEGRALVPGKRGGPAPTYAVVPVVIRDRPGELARLFQAAGAAGVNVEDVVLEHSPGLPVGVAELSVRPEQGSLLAEQLRAAGWSVHT